MLMIQVDTGAALFLICKNFFRWHDCGFHVETIVKLQRSTVNLHSVVAISDVIWLEDILLPFQSELNSTMEQLG
jgi:hypothetical protein